MKEGKDDYDTNFPIDVKSPFIALLQRGDTLEYQNFSIADGPCHSLGFDRRYRDHLSKIKRSKASSNRYR